MDKENNKDNLSDYKTKEKDSIFINIPIFNNSTDITDFLNDSFWESINLYSNLNLSCYITNTSISEIYDWYLIEIDFNWQIKSEGKFANNESLEIEKSYLKYQHQNESKGLYIYISKKPEYLDYNYENIFCIAVGPWDEIYTTRISNQ
jgi:hypothetical protein